MKFGLHLGSVNPKIWRQVTELGDELGYDSVWVPEHLVIPLAASGSPHDGASHPPIPATIPVFDALGVLNYLAAATSRIRLGTNVYNIGLRHPFITARAVSTLDVLSNGRLELGIGSSWLREEWDAVGLDFDTRGARVDEAIDICRRLWSEPEIEHHGEFFDFAPVAFEPKPVQPVDALLHIGGDGKAALRRAATVGAGWMPMNHTLDDMPASLAELAQLQKDAGRTEPLEITIPIGSTVPDVDRYAEAGVTRVLVSPWKRTSEALDGIRRFADEVMAPANAAS